MKKLPLFLTALSILASAVPLTGCSKTVKPGDVKGYDEGEQYISMWVHTIEDTPEGEAYKASVERFNEKYNGTYFADIEFIPRNDSGGGYSDKINASVMSGDLPDVITVDGPNISAYAANGIIQPLSELSEEEKSAYLDSILDQGTVDDKLYALGAMESSVGLYYNKAILEEAGIEVPDKDHPWTFSEFLDILEQLKPIMDSKNGYPLDMTFPVGESSIYYYAPFIWSNGGDLVSEDGISTRTKMRMCSSILEDWWKTSICQQRLLKTCLKADVQRSSLTVHGKSTRSIRATATSTLVLHRILSVTTGTAEDIRRLVPGHMLPLQKRNTLKPLQSW